MIKSMSSVTQFKNFLFNKSLSKNKVRCTLYNYLSLFCYAKQKLTPEILHQFYKTSLSFPYWQTWWAVLKEGIEQELHDFAKECALSTEFNTADWKWKDYKQRIVIDDKKDLIEIVDGFLERRASKGDKIRVFDFYSDQVMVVVLKMSKQIKVYSFSPLVILNEGYLEPICSFSELHYSTHCELHSGYWHQIRTPDSGFIRFQMKNNKVYGYECRDSFFRAINHFQDIPVEKHDALFNTLKRMECFFIEPRSDQYYKQLVQLLHDHYRTLLLRPFNTMTDMEISRVMEAIQQSLIQAKKAIKYFYSQDPLLVLLIANIEFHLRKMQSGDIHLSEIISNPSKGTQIEINL